MKPPCTYSPDQWINFCDYTPLQIGLVLVGTVFWNIAYGVIIRNGLRYRYVEMPYLAGASNFAWELVWGFVLLTDMGRLFVWGLRGWFFMDVFIFALLLRYGSKQLVNPGVRPYFVWIKLSVFLFWIPVFYYFYQEGYDTSMGATSAYLITVVMSALYIQHILSRPEGSVFSGLSAWCQFISNTLMSVFVWLKYPDKHFLQLLTLAVFILNAVYVLIQYRQAASLRHPVLPLQSAAVQAD
ncbi:transmembrane-type terpene cyclase [Fibrisoma limi]|uniref:transmembrane-type terpene cyclase n=1 Tax=Fibrisoma limi TaxID=663275 RepID=UPI0002D72ED3|nr:hypothetical protein [Fibrisoma limi]